MRRLPFLICFAIFSCSQSKSMLNSDDSKLYIELTEKFIVHDSLYETRTINKYLLPYEYYEKEYSENGYQVPPPYSIGYKNEFDFVDSKELSQFFSDSSSIAHVKYQLLNSKETAKNLKINRSDLIKLGLDNKDQNSWYSFYLPVFNADSTAVYMQYDFYTNGFGSTGYGNGAIFINKKGLWEYHSFIPVWTN